MDITSMAWSLKTTRKETTVNDTGDKVFVCSMAADLTRAQCDHRLTTKELKLDVPDAVSLRCADPVFPTAILGGLEPPLDIVLDLVEYVSSGGLEVCNDI